MSLVKDLFISRWQDKGVLVEIDCKQLEVCALAEITGDPVLIKEMNDGVDIHRANAASWKRKTLKDVTDEERKAAKKMSFQMQYGASAKGMAAKLGLEVAETKAFLDAYFAKYKCVSGISDYLALQSKRNSQEIEPLSKQHSIPVDTPTGAAYTAGVYQNKYNGKWEPSFTQMKNYPVQGFATGDFVPLVLNMMQAEIEGFSLQDTVLFCNTIHDSGMFDCHVDSLACLLFVFEKVFNDIPETFKELFDYELKVNYTYTVKIGQTWGDMQELSRQDCLELLGA